MPDTAIIVASFGTSFWENLNCTIGAVERDIQKAFPGCPVYRVFTSGMIRKKLHEEYGMKIDSMEQMLSRLQKQGVRRVICQPTHIIFGHEYGKLIAAARKFPDLQICFGKPLLSEAEDYFQFIDAMKDFFSKDGCTLFMGHGTDHFANAVYPALNFYFSMAGFDNVFAGTVEGYPELGHMIQLLKKRKAQRVLLLPLMLVAGEHVNYDMVHDEDSWKNTLERSGFFVSYQMKGLGENQKIRDIYIRHVETAAGALL